MRWCPLLVLAACSSSAPAAHGGGAAKPAAPPAPGRFEVADWCGDGRVTGGEVCDPNVLWDERCPAGWGMCWTCSASCRSWGEISTNADNAQAAVADNRTLWPASMIPTGAPPACSQSEGVQRTFDAKGRVVAVEAPGRAMWRTWDDDGHLLSTRDDRDIVQSTWEGGRIASKVVFRARLVPGSYPAQYTAGAEYARETWRYDDRGKLLENIASMYPGAPPRIERFAYDANGHVISRSRDGQFVMAEKWTRTYRYDSRGRLIETLQDGAITSRIVYDDPAERIELIYPDRGLQRWHYTRGRLSRFESSMPSGAYHDELVQDTQGRTVAEHFVTEAAPNASSHWRWEWGPFGIVRELRTINGRDEESSWRYDAMGRLLEADDGRYVDRIAYDARGLPSHHARTSHDPDHRADEADVDLAWTDDGGLSLARGSSAGMAATEAWTWDGRALATRTLATPLAHHEYDYRCLGDVLRAMPRRGFTERPRRSTLDAAARVERDPRHIHMTDRDRNRYDPADWNITW